MKIIPKFLLIALITINLISCQRCYLRKEFTTEDQWQEVVAYARQHLALEGTLVQKPDGYAYIKVDDAYIHDLFPRVHAEQGYEKPPYFRKSDAPGAHVSVAYADEKVRFVEIGKTFQFRLEKITVVHVNKTTSYIILEVSAPQLEALRRQYGLSPKLHGHEFHISIAKKVSRANF